MPSNKRKKKKSVRIPNGLALLLSAERKDLKDPKDYKSVQKLAKALLRVLILAKD